MIDDMVFVDVETIRLEPDRDVVWEIALLYPSKDLGRTPAETVVWQIMPDLALADPKALEVNRFHERLTPALHGTPVRTAALVQPDGDYALPYPVTEIVKELQSRLAGKTLVGSKPTFDMDHLAAFCGTPPKWRHHPLDIASMVYGFSAVFCHSGPPKVAFRSEDLSRRLGVEPAGFDRHTALGDCQWAYAQYRAMTCGVNSEE